MCSRYDGNCGPWFEQYQQKQQVKNMTQPLTPAQQSEIIDYYQGVEQVAIEVFFGSSRGNKDLPIEVAVLCGPKLEEHLKICADDIIEQLVCDTPASSGDINNFQPWLASPGERAIVTGHYAYATDGLKFYNLVWQRVH